MKLDRPVGLPATAVPGLAVLLFHVHAASLKTAGSLIVLLAAVVTTAAGLTVAVSRLRLRPHALVRTPGVRTVADPGPLGQVDIRHAGPMSSIDPSAAAFPRNDGGVRSSSTAWAGVMCRVSTSCAIAPLTPADEKDVPSQEA
jgi:hypothetical protein